MAAITPTSVYRESLGSLTLMMANMTLSTSSDTYTIAAGSPVLSFWGQSNSGVALNDPDITYTQSSGVFTFSSGTVQPTTTTLFFLMRT